MSQWPRVLRRRSSAARLLRLWFRIPPRACLSVYCECCVLSGRGLCDELITRPEESYRLWCVVVCELKSWGRRGPWPHGGGGGVVAVAPKTYKMFTFNPSRAKSRSTIFLCRRNEGFKFPADRHFLCSTVSVTDASDPDNIKNTSCSNRHIPCLWPNIEAWITFSLSRQSRQHYRSIPVAISVILECNCLPIEQLYTSPALPLIINPHSILCLKVGGGHTWGHQ